MITYNKLVRDRIPEIIKNSCKEYKTRILNEEEHFEFFEKKLDEEVQEFHEDKNTEKLADILEVVFSLGEKLGLNRDELMKLQDQKGLERGGFKDGIFLEYIE